MTSAVPKCSFAISVTEPISKLVQQLLNDSESLKSMEQCFLYSATVVEKLATGPEHPRRTSALQ